MKKRFSKLMENERRGFLPAPFHGIRYRFWVDWYVLVDYTGNLEDMLKAGVLTPEAVDLCSRLKRSGKVRTVHGCRLRLHRKPTTRDPNRVHVRLSALTAECALELPGVRNAYPEGITLRELSSPAANSGRCSQNSGHSLASAPDHAERSRAVGRYQRLARWTSIGKLIIPDWPSIRSETIEARSQGDAA